MRSTVSGLVFLSLFLVLGLAIGNRGKCEKKHCVEHTKCPSFLDEIKRWRVYKESGNNEAANELSNKLESMVCDERARKVCCLEDKINTGFGDGDTGKGVCGSHILGFVRGQQYPKDKNIFQMAAIYCVNTPDYWLTPDGFTGQGFIAILDSSGPFMGIKLGNTDFGEGSSTKSFSFSFGPSPDGPWTVALSNYQLEEKHHENPPPVQDIIFKEEHYTGKYVKWDVEEYYGDGAGLQYLDMILPEQGNIVIRMDECSIGTIRGDVSFKQSSTCHTTGPIDYEISHDCGAIIPYKGICYVEQIFAYMTPYTGTYNAPANCDAKEFEIVLDGEPPHFYLRIVPVKPRN